MPSFALAKDLCEKTGEQEAKRFIHSAIAFELGMDGNYTKWLAKYIKRAANGNLLMANSDGNFTKDDVVIRTVSGDKWCAKKGVRFAA